MKLSRICCIIFLSVSTACTPRPKPAPVINNAVVLAEVGDRKITDVELKTRIEELQENFPLNYSTHPQKLELLNQLINVELLYQESLRIGLADDFIFKAKLADAYIDKLSREARKSVTQKQIDQYYEDHKDEIDQVAARHILLKFPDKKNSETVSGMRKKIESIRAEALQDPSNFSNLARKYSEDGSAGSGGELGLFSKGMMVPEFSAATFKLKKIGEISPVVETSFGFHIIQLSQDRRGKSFYEEGIRNKIVTDAQKHIFNTEIERLKKGTKISLYEKELHKLSPLPTEVLTDPEKLIPEDGIPNAKDPKK